MVDEDDFDCDTLLRICTSDVFSDNLRMVTRAASNSILNPMMTKAKAMMMLTARLLKMLVSFHWQGHSV